MLQKKAAAILVLGMNGVASAGPMLLASYTGPGSPHVGQAPWDDPRISFVLMMSPISPFGARPALGTGRFWSDGEVGTVDFNEDNSPDFGLLESYATNGENNSFTIYALFSNNLGAGMGSSESVLFDRHPPIDPPDLIGYDLETVRLIVNEVDFEPWLAPCCGNGYIVGFDVTYEFYGSPIPEPAVVTQLLLGIVVLVHQRKRPI
jgi:hypothetical protein